MGRVASRARRIRRLLIANRGEIAARVIRTCTRLGIESVLAASDADLESLPARLADRVVRLGPANAAQSYLDSIKRAQQVELEERHRVLLWGGWVGGLDLRDRAPCPAHAVGAGATVDHAAPLQ